MSGLRILIVDDEEPVVNFVCSALIENGFEAVGAINVERAFEMIWTGPTVDLVISDFEMPRMHGLEFLDAVGAVSPSTALMLMSGAGSVVVRPPIAFLKKPFTLAELLAAVKASLEESRGPRAAVASRQAND